MVGACRSSCHAARSHIRRPAAYLLGLWEADHSVSVEQDFRASSGQSNITVADEYTTESRYGLINSKVRHMIVIECYEDHYIAVPLFTHNGRGLTRKRQPDEYIRSVSPLLSIL